MHDKESPAKLLIFLCAALFFIPANLRSQQKLAVLPVTGAELTPGFGQPLTAELTQIIRERYSFDLVPGETVTAYFKRQPVRIDTSVNFLSGAADALDVDLLIVPGVRKTTTGRVLNLALFDRDKQKIVRTSSRDCQCSAPDLASFPFAESLESLFEAPQIILAVEDEEEALPPPPAIGIGRKPVAADSGATSVSVLQSNRKHGSGWFKYAAGAVLLGGGVLYLATQGGGDNPEPLTKLKDPPAPPGSN